MSDQIIDRTEPAQALRERYCAAAGGGDVLCAATGAAAEAWNIALAEVLRAGDGDVAVTQELIQRRVDEIGIGFRLLGESEERRCSFERHTSLRIVFGDFCDRLNV